MIWHILSGSLVDHLSLWLLLDILLWLLLVLDILLRLLLEILLGLLNVNLAIGGLMGKCAWGHSGAAADILDWRDVGKSSVE